MVPPEISRYSSSETCKVVLAKAPEPSHMLHGLILVWEGANRGQLQRRRRYLHASALVCEGLTHTSRKAGSTNTSLSSARPKWRQAIEPQFAKCREGASHYEDGSFNAAHAI
eukprot:3221452-Amphidinium_carterae.1